MPYAPGVGSVQFGSGMRQAGMALAEGIREARRAKEEREGLLVAAEMMVQEYDRRGMPPPQGFEKVPGMSSGALKGFLGGAQGTLAAVLQEEESRRKDQALQVQLERAKADAAWGAAQESRSKLAFDEAQADRMAGEEFSAMERQGAPDQVEVYPGLRNIFGGKGLPAVTAPTRRDLTVSESFRNALKVGDMRSAQVLGRMVDQDGGGVMDRGVPELMTLGNTEVIHNRATGQFQISPESRASADLEKQRALIGERGEQLSRKDLLASYQADLKALDNPLAWSGTTPEQRALERRRINARIDAVRSGDGEDKAESGKRKAEMPEGGAGPKVTAAQQAVLDDFKAGRISRAAAKQKLQSLGLE